MKQWTASYQFEWTPIITFSMRRLHLLEWFEANTQPLAFFEDASKVGIAVHARDLRVTVTQSGLRIENSNADKISTEMTAEAISGILEILEPSRVELAYSAQALSSSLGGRLYDDAAGALAAHVSGVQGVGFTAKDASILADFETEGWTLQPEWGIVTRDELVERVENPKISRGGALRPKAKISSRIVSQVPEVSVFVDNMTLPASPVVLSDAEGIIKSISAVDRVTRLLAEQIVEPLKGEKS